MKKNIAVIGCGIFGISTAYKLLQSNNHVTLIDPLSISDDLKTSNGESRNIRFSHANDEFYSLLSWKAAGEWKKIEKLAGEKLFYDTGVIWFASDNGGWESHSEETLNKLKRNGSTLSNLFGPPRLNKIIALFILTFISHNFNNIFYDFGFGIRQNTMTQIKYIRVVRKYIEIIFNRLFNFIFVC